MIIMRLLELLVIDGWKVGIGCFVLFFAVVGAQALVPNFPHDTNDYINNIMIKVY